MAAKAGISASTVSRWETATTSPCIPELNRLLSALQATPQERDRAYQAVLKPRALKIIGEKSPNAPCSAPAPADLLRAVRLRKGWSQEQTASKIGVSASMLSRWENYEAWPDAFRLHALLLALGAREPEIVWLAQGGGRHGAQPISLPTSAADLARFIDDAANNRLSIDPSLLDLVAVALECRIWNRYKAGDPVLPLLVEACVWRSRILLLDGRVVEAGEKAAQALSVASKCQKFEPYWLYAAHVLAKSSAETYKRFRPMDGAAILDDYLPLATSFSPAFEVWFLRSLAEYAAMAGKLSLAQQANDRALACDRRPEPLADRHNLYSHALVKICTGQVKEALRLMEETPTLDCNPKDAPLQQLNEACLWQLALSRAGRKEEAIGWGRKAQTILEDNNMWQARARTL